MPRTSPSGIRTCPNCDSDNAIVTDTRNSYDAARTRRYRCKACKHSFFSVEIQITREQITLGKHYHVSQDLLKRLLQTVYA